MTIIWRGRGLAIAIVAFACLIVTELVVERWFGDAHYYQAHGWPKLLGLWLGASAVFALRGWLGVPEWSPSPGTNPSAARAIATASNPSAGPQATVPTPPEGELFFIKARYWPAILLALGVVFLFVRV